MSVAGRGQPLAFIQAAVTAPHGDDDPCVVWPDGWSTDRQGYPQIRLAGRLTTAMRALLALRDGEPTDDRPWALHGPCHNPRCITHGRWGTRAENEADKVRDGTHHRGERHHNAKLSGVRVRKVRAALAAGATQTSVAEQFGVSRQTINDIATGRAWAHVG